MCLTCGQYGHSSRLVGHYLLGDMVVLQMFCCSAFVVALVTLPLLNASYNVSDLRSMVTVVGWLDTGH